MATLVIVGAQWGDEGKGRIVDLLSQHAHMVVRFQGGANAGHTVVVGDEEFILHLVPAGIIQSHTTCVIGNGVALDIPTLISEIEMLAGKGIKVDGRLIISDRAHVTLPYHRLLDGTRPDAMEGLRLVTTNRGIRPTYVDKVARVGIRVSDLLDEELLRQKLRTNVREKLPGLHFIPESAHPREDEMCRECSEWARRLAPWVGNTSAIVNRAIDEGKNVLFEGAQGTALDVDFGTYPFVTSSNTTAGGACTGSGVGPSKIDRVIGLAKAYTTRVGDEKPFPSLMPEEMEKKIRERGGEYGATTGRPRRCGWFDAVLMRHAVMVNGLQSIVLSKLDVLDGLDKVKICVGYQIRGQLVSEFPADLRALEICEPVYQELDGWKESCAQARNYQSLPVKARRYLDRIAELSGVPISIISVGRRREDAIVLDTGLPLYRFGRNVK